MIQVLATSHPSERDFLKNKNIDFRPTKQCHENTNTAVNHGKTQKKCWEGKFVKAKNESNYMRYFEPTIFGVMINTQHDIHPRLSVAGKNSYMQYF